MELIVELLEFIEDAAVELGVVEEISYVHEIFRRRTGADRQLKVYELTGSLKAVVQYVIEETEAGIPVA
jgi:carboxylate-amine ligase